MRMKLYNALVNRHRGIAVRYHRLHDGRHDLGGRLISWAYLLWMNFAYHCLFCRFLDRPPLSSDLPVKELPVKESESERFLRLNPELRVDLIVQRLSAFDVISFDLFDTLLLRPFDTPQDLFFLIGERLGVSDFKNRRICAEETARRRRFLSAGDNEVTLREIWEVLSAELSVSPETGARLEAETEEALCLPNPLLLAVWRRLKESGKRLVVTTDMYLPEDVLSRMMERCGFTGREALFVSCVHRKSKSDGRLFDVVKAAFPDASIIHVGDHPVSDGKTTEKHGLAAFLIPSVRSEGDEFRTKDLSALVGSAWRGIVNARLYSGAEAFSRYYEYGYVCGGLFVLGYCQFIHEAARREGIGRLLFLSRDGDTLKRVYDRLYPGEDTVYLYWSRRAAARLTAGLDRQDYFSRFLYQKVNLGIPIREILAVMDLSPLQESLFSKESVGKAYDLLRKDGVLPESGRPIRLLSPDEPLTDQNAPMLRALLESVWEEILECYRSQRIAAGRVIGSLLDGCERAAAVDIGWAGSGARSLALLAEREWHLLCEIRGIVAGTNTPMNDEPDAAEPFLQSGKLMAYLFSQSLNRDLWKHHDPGRDYNIFFELLLSSDTP
ncbi:MAG: hypothetical protein K5696_12855, partial [Lachnospiraceae bacterium]|nr:hypothetical protein [Lachnospiraceae bacterium]